jgi:hypothetical protein
MYTVDQYWEVRGALPNPPPKSPNFGGFEIRLPLVGIPEHALDAFRVEDKTKTPVKIDHLGVGEKGDVADVGVAEFTDHIFHILQTEVDHHIPDRGVKGVVRSRSGEAHQPAPGTVPRVCKKT